MEPGLTRAAPDMFVAIPLRDFASSTQLPHAHILCSYQVTAQPVFGLAKIADNGPDKILEIGGPHVNQIPTCAGIESNELLVAHFSVQIDWESKQGSQCRHSTQLGVRR